MPIRIRPARCVLFALVAALVATTARAEVTGVEIRSRADVLNGRTFGDAGAYEKLSGTIHFALDPNNPHNTIIVDLNMAPKNAQGKVEFSSDLFIIKPKDPSKGNGVLLFDVVNRGRKGLLGVFSRGTGSDDPTTEADFGDAYLLKQGYTLVMVGWQFDVPTGGKQVGMKAPIATDNGAPIKGWLRMPLTLNEPAAAADYTVSYNTRAYPPLDLKNPAYRLTVREGIFAPMRLIPRDQWSFAKADGTPDPYSIAVKGGLKPGLTYEVYFESQNPPVAGLGFAALRDAASAWKNGTDPTLTGKFAYMYGASQTGRMIRGLIKEGFTIDESGRKAFDAAFVHTGATGYGSFNERFAAPNELGTFTQTVFPFHYKTEVDPVTGREDGFGKVIPAGLEPKLFLVDSSSEYWDRGRVAAMRHLSLDGSEDFEDAPNVRVYQMSSTKHGAGAFPPSDSGGVTKDNANNYRWTQRGLLAALDAWTRANTAPPASRHPRLSDGTLVAHRDYRFPAVPGVQPPTYVPGGYRADVPTPQSALAFKVPKVDAFGNDLGGIRLPVIEVPLATQTGWMFRSEKIGAPSVLIPMAGMYIPLPLTKADRERTKDPRQSIEELYAGRADYLKKVQAAGEKLAKERYILAEDVQAIVEEAGKQWDFLVAGPRSSTAQQQ
ncbi:MAG: alpha/beta hydrolase domain-containing protein [Vicinamibacterales bacterium]